MKVRFDVTGSDARELEEQAQKMLSSFGSRHWHIYIEAEVAMGTHQGEVVLWRGEVEAHD